MHASRFASALVAVGISALLGSATHAADPPGEPKVGFVFVARQAALRESPETGGKELAKVPSGLRVVFRRVVVVGGVTAWYRVEPPGGSVGWIAASDVSDKRPGPAPQPKPITVESSGVGLAKTSSSQTAAARGLSKAAVEYVADRETLKKSADEFITLEHTVERQFDDPHDSNGDYPDVDVPKRSEHAAAFKGAIE